ncbi:MAG: InlB B-repeat-containing protein, partial [Erysipelotrichaceae bacterium]
SDYVDPFMGYNSGSDLAYEYIYFDDTLYTYDNLFAVAVGKTTIQLKTEAGYPNFDFADIWFVVSTYNDGYAQFDYGMNRVNLYDGDTLVDVLLYVDDTTVDTGDVADYVKAGYTFGGWYTDEALTTPFDEVTLVEGDVNLYAKTTSQIPNTSDSAGVSQMILGFGTLLVIVSRKRKENLV